MMQIPVRKYDEQIYWLHMRHLDDISQGDRRCIWKDTGKWTETMKVLVINGSSSGADVWLESPHWNQDVRMFLSDFNLCMHHLNKDGERLITGTWEFVKRGRAYGVKLIS